MRNLKITFIDHHAINYDGSVLEQRGLGGSESSLIYMSEELVKLGFEVVVFNNTSSEIIVRGVKYRPLELMRGETTDILIGMRSPEIFMSSFRYPINSLKFSSKANILWRHDIQYPLDEEIAKLIKDGLLHEVFTLSDWHTIEFLREKNASYLKKYIYETRNGVTLYSMNVEKDPRKFVYTSAAIKGMVPLVQYIWPRILEAAPDAHLTIVGGYYEDVDDDNKKIVEKYKELDLPNITFTDVLRPPEVLHEVATSLFFIYPNKYPETFGISTLEALCYNTIPITVNYGALEETVPDKYSYKITGPINSEEEAEKFVELVKQVLQKSPEELIKKVQGQSDIVNSCRWQHVALEWKRHLLKYFNESLSEEEEKEYKKARKLFNKTFNRVIDTENKEVYGALPDENKIYICVSKPDNIPNNTLESVYNLKIPSGYDVKFPQTWSYLKDQNKNFSVDQAIKNQCKYIFFIEPGADIPRKLLVECLPLDKEVVVYKDNNNIQALLVKTSVLKYLEFPQFKYYIPEGRENIVNENQYFLDKLEEIEVPIYEVCSNE